MSRDVGVRPPVIARWTGALAVAATAAVIAVQGQGSQTPVDLLITNAVLVDGTGAPGRRTTLAIAGGRVTRIDAPASTPATERFDAAGLTVTPGFIDVHTHADDLASRPQAENFIRMGVTTIVAGNCGSSASSVGEALDRITETGAAVNFATLVGHNTVRSAVMGSANRVPTLEEMARMKAMVYKGLAEGAIGFSTGLQYVPGTYARASEITELARVVANEGGIYATHMRNEGTELLASVEESIRVARTLDLRLQISHLKVDSPSRWGDSAAALKLIDDARQRGVNVQADQYAYTAGASSLSIRFPSWALEGGSARARERLDDPATWSKIKAEMLALVKARGFEDLSWATVATYRADPSLNGLTIKAIAEKTRGSGSADAQFEVARDLMRGGGASMVYHFMSEDDLARIMRHPMVSVASDAGLVEPGAGAPHPRGYGNTARVLGEYVRARGILTLPDAVRKMTSLPAEHMGFTGRGVVKAGAAADLVFLDPASVSDTSTYAAPHSYPAGLPHVMVNGVFVVRDSKPTGARPGVVLRLR